MNKKIISRLLLSSAVILPICAVVVSCNYPNRARPPVAGSPSTPVAPTPDDKLKVELNNETKKVVFGFTGKETKLASTANKDNFMISGYDDKKFKVLVTSVTPNDHSGTTVVNFKVVDIKKEDKQSDEKSVTITGFKKDSLEVKDLVAFVKEVKIDYADKANVYPWDAKAEKIMATNVHAKAVVTDLKVTGLNSKNSKAVVSFMFGDKYNPSVKIKYIMEVDGFKVLSKDHSNWTKTLFDDTNKYIVFDDDHSKTLNLYKELAKKDAELTFNFSSDKVLIPVEGKVVNFLKSDTFIEVGSLTPEYKTLHEELKEEIKKEISSSIRLGDIDAYDVISKLFTLPKEEAVKYFDQQDTSFTIGILLLKNQITFVGDYANNLKTLINKDNFLVVYDYQKGLFVMQSGDAEIDLNKPETFTELIGFKDVLKNKVTQIIKETLKKNKVEETKSDIFFDETNFISGYIFQKDGANLITGLKIKQLPEKMAVPKPS